MDHVTELKLHRFPTIMKRRNRLGSTDHQRKSGKPTMRIPNSTLHLSPQDYMNISSKIQSRRASNRKRKLCIEVTNDDNMQIKCRSHLGGRKVLPIHYQHLLVQHHQMNCTQPCNLLTLQGKVIFRFLPDWNLQKYSKQYLIIYCLSILWWCIGRSLRKLQRTRQKQHHHSEYALML